MRSFTPGDRSSSAVPSPRASKEKHIRKSRQKAAIESLFLRRVFFKFVYLKRADYTASDGKGSTLPPYASAIDPAGPRSTGPGSYIFAVDFGA